MTVVVLGGSGYLGAAVVAALRTRGHDVLPASRTTATGLRADVRRPDLGLGPKALAELRERTTAVVSCVGSVDWQLTPAVAEQVHHRGALNALAFAAGCPGLGRFVHVSSVLALGRADRRVGSRELDVGQDFRTWYEWAKFVAERAVRREAAVPSRIVRFGPLLGQGPAGPPTVRHGLLAALPFLLRGYPVHLERGGAFPCYPSDVGAAAEVVARAVDAEGAGDTWTWYDPAHPTLAEVLVALCSAWGVLPRLVRSPLVGRLSELVAERLGAPRALLAYAAPWPEIDPAVLDAVPGPRPVVPSDYVAETGRLLRTRPAALAAV